jgi:hypothetical protein
MAQELQLARRWCGEGQLEFLCLRDLTRFDYLGHFDCFNAQINGQRYISLDHKRFG